MSRVFAALVVLLTASACSYEHTSKVLMPSDLGSLTSRSYVGTWTSTSTTVVGSSSCGNFVWQVTNQTLTIVSGTFSADCGGGLHATGTASGQIGGASVPVTATGAATATGMTTSCGFSISGPAEEIDANTLRVVYSGTTCRGPIGGTEVLRRH